MLKKYGYYMVLIIILILTALIYFPTFNNDFINLDDHLQVTENPDIKSLSLNGIKTIFTSNYVGMYQPLTTLIFAFEYAVFGLNPSGYHLISLIFHLLNVILIFYFCILLFKNYQTAMIVSALFACHPLFVEAVGWVSARSTLTYSFFYLLSLIFYLGNKESNKRLYYFLSLLFFTFSMLSKAMAVTLPLILFLLDYYQKRKINWKLVIEKTPYFLIAITFGIVAVFIRENVGDLNSTNYYFDFGDRLIISFYQIVWYFSMAFFPLSLSSYYPDPTNISLIYYMSPAFILILTALVVFLKKIRKELIFATLFLLISVGIVLKLFLFFDQNVTGRYTYLAYFGLFALFAILIQRIPLFGRKAIYSFIPVLVIVVFFSYQTNERIKVYKNSFTLWTDVLSKFPESHLAYINMGDAYKNSGDYKKALEYVNKGMKYYKAPKAYMLRGYLHTYNEMYSEALDDYNQVIIMQPEYYQAYSNRGNLFMKMNNISAAFDDYNMAIRLTPDIAGHYFNRAVAFDVTGDIQKAIEDYHSCLRLDPQFTDAYLNLSIDYLIEGNYQNAMDYINDAIELDKESGKLFMIRGEINSNLGLREKACEDYRKAAGFGFDEAVIEISKHCQ